MLMGVGASAARLYAERTSDGKFRMMRPYRPSKGKLQLGAENE